MITNTKNMNWHREEQTTKARTDVLVTDLAGHHCLTAKEAEQMVGAVH
jgi:hypothetical protein